MTSKQLSVVSVADSEGMIAPHFAVLGSIGRLLHRTTLRENEGETRFLTSNLLKVVVQFGDAANRKTYLETVYRGFLMSGVA